MVVVVAGASAGVGCAITRRFRRSAAFLSVLVDRSAEHWPPGMDVAAGEQTYDPFYFQRMLDAGAIDVIQANTTRCGGIIGLPFARRGDGKGRD